MTTLCARIAGLDAVRNQVFSHESVEKVSGRGGFGNGRYRTPDYRTPGYHLTSWAVASVKVWPA